jgi:hypothetical protein
MKGAPSIRSGYAQVGYWMKVHMMPAVQHPVTKNA